MAARSASASSPSTHETKRPPTGTQPFAKPMNLMRPRMRGSSRQQLDRAHVKHNRLQNRSDLAEDKPKKVAAELQNRTQDRDRATAALYVNETLVDAARSSIARLERRVNDLGVDRQELERLEYANASLTSDLAAATQRCADLDAARTKAVAENIAIRDRIAGLVTFVQPGSSPSRSA
ncbi:hypothetical protein PF011_g21580 [Phytophthora fragariae]|uniref:Uncharacterized protein n=1 Tax=Phytophthora fragariae TaxID=53985 RepID=A0A6A3IHN3_9STRA|nr:hypothetical protein PF011_g21580 [Phytophthora fragariae]